MKQLKLSRHAIVVGLSLFIIAFFVGCSPIKNKKTIPITMIDIRGAETLSVIKNYALDDSERYQFIKTLSDGTEEIVTHQTADGKIIPKPNPPSFIKSVNDQYILIIYNNSISSDFSTIYGCYLVNKETGSAFTLADRDSDPSYILNSNSKDIQTISDLQGNIYYTTKGSLHKIDLSSPDSPRFIPNYISQSSDDFYVYMDLDSLVFDNNGVFWESYRNTIYLIPTNGNITEATKNLDLNNFDSHDLITIGGKSYAVVINNDNWDVFQIYSVEMDWNTNSAIYTYKTEILRDFSSSPRFFNNGFVVLYESKVTLVTHDRSGELKIVPTTIENKSNFKYHYPYLYSYSGSALLDSDYDELYEDTDSVGFITKFDLETENYTDIKLDERTHQYDRQNFGSVDIHSIQIYTDGTISCRGVKNYNNKILTIDPEGNRSYRDSYRDSDSVYSHNQFSIHINSKMIN